MWLWPRRYFAVLPVRGVKVGSALATLPAGEETTGIGGHFSLWIPANGRWKKLFGTPFTG